MEVALRAQRLPGRPPLRAQRVRCGAWPTGLRPLLGLSACRVARPWRWPRRSARCSSLSAVEALETLRLGNEDEPEVLEDLGDVLVAWKPPKMWAQKMSRA